MKLYFKLLFVVLFGLLTSAAFADPPSRVARLSFIGGRISVQPGGVDEWVEAGLNRPLTTADRVWADTGSRAELQLGGATIRINDETSLGLTNVGDDVVQLSLDQGTLNVHVDRIEEDEAYEVDTPNVAFAIMRAGEYRFYVDSDGDRTTVTVWRGEGEALGNGESIYVRSRQQAMFFGGQSFDHALTSVPAFDAFDEWCRVRDEREAGAQSARYVSPDMIGYEDLDQYGSWQQTTEYGPVWEPSAVSSGWAPYRDGHWIWVEPWGWTWVDDQPWGFAPFHYGRWVNYGGRWGWCPGPRVRHVYYAPALVAWIGGSGFNLSFGGGPHVGWFPLGYGEPYYPHYHASPRYFDRVNETNTRITNITNIRNNYYNNTNVTNIRYINRTIPGAVTVIPQQALITSQPVGRTAVPLPVNRVVSAPVVIGPAIPPARASVIGNRPPVRVPPPAARAQRPVVADRTPPPRPVPFEARQAAIVSNGGRPLDASAEEQLRSRAPQPRTAIVVPARQVQAAPAPNAPAAATHPVPPATPAPAIGQPAASTPQPAPANRNPYISRPPERNTRESAPAEPAAPAAGAPAYRPVPRPPVSMPSVGQPNPRWERPAETPAHSDQVVPRPERTRERDMERNGAPAQPQAAPARPEPAPARHEPERVVPPPTRPSAPPPEPRIERREPPARQAMPERQTPPPQVREAPPAYRPAPPPQREAAPAPRPEPPRVHEAPPSRPSPPPQARESAPQREPAKDKDKKFR